MRSRSLVGVALVAVAGVSCAGGEDAQEPADTSDITRSLLSQPAGGGDASPVEGAPEVVGRMTRAYLPDLGFNHGEVEALLKVIEFSDFGCGYCRRFHEESFPTLKSQFIDTGMIEWKFLPFITGTFGNSLAVTEAAECTLEQDAGAYQAFGEMLWARQQEWKPSAEPEPMVRGWAGELGLDMDRFDSCLAEDRRFERVAGATVAANQLGVRATPTFWIVGYGPLQGALPLDAFQGIFSTIYAEVAAAAVDSVAGAPGPPGA